MIARYGDTDYGYSEAGYGYGVSSSVIETLRYGVSSPATKASQSSVNVSWFPYLPSHQQGELVRWSAFFTTPGNFKIVVARRNGYTWDRVYLSENISASAGVNTFTDADFGSINIEVGDVVGWIGSVGRIGYLDGEGFGRYSIQMSGELAASGNVLSFSNAVRNWQMSYSVRGVVEPSTTLFDETFATSSIPWDWEHASAAWTYDGTKATSGTAGIANSLNYRFSLGNLSTWTWTADFTFDTAGARFAMLTRNAIQTTAGFAIEVNQSTGNMVVYRTATGNGWDNSGALSAVVTQATGITFATATTYRMTIAKSFRSASITITDVATPETTYTLSWDQENATVAPTRGFGYGKPSVAAVAGTVSVLSTTFSVPTAQPDWMFVGDSITEGSGLSSSTLSMARLLATDLNYTIQTSAQGGAGTLHMPSRIASELPHIRPKRIHFMIGTNDTVEADWKARMAGVRDLCSGICQQTIIGCVPAEASDANPENEFNPYILSEGWDTVRHDLALSTDGTGAGRIADLYSDTLHPNADGHVAMRDRFRSDLGV